MGVVASVTSLLTIAIILYPLFRFGIIRVPTFLPMPVLGVMAFAVLINILIISIATIFVTHRIAGPMYALARQFRRVEEGHWNSPLTIRKGDELRYVVRNFNSMIESLVKQGNELQQQLSHSLSESERNQDAGRAGLSSAISELTRKLASGKDDKADD